MAAISPAAVRNGVAISLWRLRRVSSTRSQGARCYAHDLGACVSPALVWHARGPALASMCDLVQPVQLAISLQPASFVRALECLMALRHMPRELVFNHKGDDPALLFIELLPVAGADYAILRDTLRSLPGVSSVEELAV